ncbi:TonB-dependent receptor [Dasania marina]|uniref:TonB-dependent receptor n=1 Tax=Dasania marina TaxID=471499 RepID=UPI0003776F35|nr:TonB-dependent receptor [Dasania marina]
MNTIKQLPFRRNKINHAIAKAVAVSGVSVFLASQFPVSAHAAEKFALEEVVVTARKREESLQDVPIAVSAFGSDQLTAMGANETVDLVNRVPNMAYDGGGNALSGMGIRGIVTTTRNIGFESGMGAYIDQVYLGRPVAFNQPLADVAQVEVLRGPQGTLFGRNTIAGAINITTKKPNHEEFEGTAKATIGNFNTVNASLFMTGPLTDDLAGKVSVYSQERDGSAKNYFNGKDINTEDKKGIRLGLNWDASEKLELSFNADYLEQKMDRFFSELNYTPDFPFSPPAFSGDLGTLTTDPYSGDAHPNQSSQDGPTFENREVGGASLHVNWMLDNGMAITSITAYRIADFDLGADDDSRPIAGSHSLFGDSSDSFTQELRLESMDNEDYNWMVGFYYLDQTAEASRATSIATPAFLVGATNVNGFTLAPIGAISSESEIDTQAVALFFNSNYHLNQDLTLSLGLRYTEESKEMDFRQVNSTFTSHPSLTTAPDIDDEAISGNIALNYTLSDNSSAYVSASRGFKSGGFNPDIVPSADIGFDSETVWSYELGYKADLVDGRVRVNAALFFTDYEDLQVQRLAVTDVGVGFAINNAKAAEIFGFEGEILALLTENLQVEASVGYIDSEYTDFDNCGGDINAIDNFNSNVFTGSTLPINVESCNGNQLTLAPELTASAAVQYTQGVFDGELTYRAEWGYKSETFAEPNNFERTQVDSRDVVNLRIGYLSGDQTWSVAAWGKNIGNDEYEEFTWIIPSYNNVFSTYNIGATYGVDATYHF